MSAAPYIFCGKTDAVLALYLDGDIDGGRGSPEDSGFELVCPDALASHLRDCVTCQIALQRARRLDAVLAESAGRAAREATAHEQDGEAEARIDRMFVAVAVAAAEQDAVALETVALEIGQAEWNEPAEQPAPVQLAGERAVLLPALLLVIAATGLVSLWLLQGPRSARQDDQVRHTPVEPAAIVSPAPGSQAAGFDDAATLDGATPNGATPAAATPDGSAATISPKEHGGERDLKNGVEAARPRTGHDQILIANDGARRVRDRSSQGSALQRANAQADSPNGSSLQVARQQVGDPLELLATSLTDATLPVRERLAAATRLVQQSRPGTVDARRALAGLVQTLAASRGEPTMLADALAIAADEPHFLGYLRATLRRAEPARAKLDHEDLAAISVAARLDTGELDTAVRRVLRRHDDVLDLVIAALRLPVRTEGAASLLLACWSDLASRERIDDDLMARRLFAGQSQSTFTELQSELTDSHSAPQRVHCLLALASCADRQCTAVLLEWATASCRDEAYAAGWALSQLPHDWLAAAAGRAATDRSAFVLRAALARAGLPAAKTWLEPMRLLPHERTVVATVTFALFPRYCEWFRDGPTARSTIADD